LLRKFHRKEYKTLKSSYLKKGDLMKYKNLLLTLTIILLLTSTASAFSFQDLLDDYGNWLNKFTGRATTTSYICNPGQKIGDVNGDGQVTQADADFVHAVANDQASIPQGADICCANFNQDDVINSYDANKIQSIVSGDAQGGYCGVEYTCNDNQLVGDVNGDGEITDIDSWILLQIIGSKISRPSNQCCGDADGSGTISITDATRILQIANQNLDPPYTKCVNGNQKTTINYECKNNQKIGDINADGIVDKKDSSFLWYIKIGLATKPSENICCADVNQDGKISFETGKDDAYDIQLISQNAKQSPGTCTIATEPNCIDSDEDDYYTKGTVLYQDEIYTDRCSNNNQYIVEFYCQDDTLKDKQVPCPGEYGCQDGVCLTSSITVTCEDEECDELNNKVCIDEQWTSQDYCEYCPYDSDCSTQLSTCTEGECNELNNKWCFNQEWISTDYCDICIEDIDCTSDFPQDDFEEQDDDLPSDFLDDYTPSSSPDIDKDSTPLEDECSGCQVGEEVCLKIGARLKNGYYCSRNKNLKTQKEINIICQENFECKNKLCKDNICTNPSLLRKFMRAISFGLVG